MVTLTKNEKAVLDTIAFAEGVCGVSNNGYDVLGGYYLIVDWTKDTKFNHSFGERVAGRYQFKEDTWKGMFDGKNPPLTKDNQDNAAIRLLNKKLNSNAIDSRSVKIEELTDRTKFDIFLQKSASTWAPLPLTKTITYDGKTHNKGESWYKQPVKTADELFEVFKLALSKY